MKKSELKKALVPIIKECVQEVLLESNVLNGVIKQVAAGFAYGMATSQATQQQVAAAPQPKTSKPIYRRTDTGNFSENLVENELKSYTQELQSQRSDFAVPSENKTLKKIEETTGLKGIFENVEPIKEGPKANQYGALRDQDPSDPGVSIDFFKKLGVL